jgi:predicted nucleotidyltransferase
MKVDAVKLISGIKPVVLKGLLRKDRVDTPTAMNWLGQDEPEVTTTLKGLQKSGWIEFEGTSESVDYWRPGNKGQRLTATRLLKRISAAEGRQILDRFVDEVRAINADPTRSRRVKTILLFGSLLTGNQGGSIGDIDVVVEIAHRDLTEDVRKQLEKAEKLSKPAGLNFIDSLYWPEILIRRRLAKVSRYLSFHPASDLQIGTTSYQEVYSFNLQRDCELPPEGKIRKMARRSKEPSMTESITNDRYTRADREWPSAPDKTVSVTIDEEHGQLAQHLWMNGVAIKAIAARLRSKPAIVQAYLSTRAGNSNFHGKINASLMVTLLESLPKRRPFSIFLKVSLQPKQEVIIDIDVYGSRAPRRQGSLRRVGRRFFVNGSAVELLTTLESADRAAALWFESIRSRIRGLGLEIVVSCIPGQKIPGCASAMWVDPGSLKGPLYKLLDQLWTGPRGEYEGWDKRLSVSLEANPIVTFQDGRGSDAKVIDGSKSRAVTHVAGAMYRKFESTLNDGSSWSVYVTGMNPGAVREK